MGNEPIANSTQHSKRALFAELICVSIIFLTVTFLSSAFQKPVTVNDGKGWDGVEYYQMAEQYMHNQRIQAPGPWCYRVGTPFLVALFVPVRT